MPTPLRQHNRLQRQCRADDSAFNYNNLTSSNTGARTLANAGTIGIDGVFTQGTNAYTITAVLSTNGQRRAGPFCLQLQQPDGSSNWRAHVGQRRHHWHRWDIHDGTNVYTIPAAPLNSMAASRKRFLAFNYNNLTSSSTGARTLATPARWYCGCSPMERTPTPSTGSTINFNGSVAQTIPASITTNLTSSSTARARWQTPAPLASLGHSRGNEVYTSPADH